MTRSELTAQTRFQQSLSAIARDSNRQSPYGLQTQAGYLGKRDPHTGDRTFTAADGVAFPVRDLKGAAYPADHDASAIQIAGGRSYSR